jgi:hypothetical protein
MDQQTLSEDIIRRVDGRHEKADFFDGTRNAASG